MEFRVSHHAEWEMARRGIPLVLVQAVAENPEQRVVDESHPAVGFASRGYCSKMGRCIYCESWWTKMSSRL
jgi:hypothetical protein